MSQVKQKYLKDENGDVISPIVSTDSLRNHNGTHFMRYFPFMPQIFTSTSHNWQYDGWCKRFYADNQREGEICVANGYDYAFCNKLKNGNTETDDNSFNLGRNQIYFRVEGITTMDAWKKWLDTGSPLVVMGHYEGVDDYE